MEIAASVAASWPISSRGVAAGELEEHQIGRRIVEEGREHAGEPEIGDLVRRAVVRGDAPQQPGERRRRGRPRSIASTGMMQTKMPANSLATSRDRLPGEAVGLAMLVGREPERGERDDDERAVAHQVLQARRAVP